LEIAAAAKQQKNKLTHKTEIMAINISSIYTNITLANRILCNVANDIKPKT